MLSGSRAARCDLGLGAERQHESISRGSCDIETRYLRHHSRLTPTTQRQFDWLSTTARRTTGLSVVWNSSPLDWPRPLDAVPGQVCWPIRIRSDFIGFQPFSSGTRAAARIPSHLVALAFVHRRKRKGRLLRRLQVGLQPLLPAKLSCSCGGVLTPSFRAADNAGRGDPAQATKVKRKRAGMIWRGDGVAVLPKSLGTG